jgi:hypothetical protein
MKQGREAYEAYHRGSPPVNWWRLDQEERDRWKDVYEAMELLMKRLRLLSSDR